MTASHLLYNVSKKDNKWLKLIMIMATHSEGILMY